MDNQKDTPFYVIQDKRVPLPSLADNRLGRLLKYWHRKKKDAPLPIGACIDPIELSEHLSRLHILEVKGPRSFFYTLYGASVTNPDLADMTEKFTTDYQDKAFGELVTKHLSECVELANPICRQIIAIKIGLPYAYMRLALPWSTDGINVSKLMVSPLRILVPKELDRSKMETTLDP